MRHWISHAIVCLGRVQCSREGHNSITWARLPNRDSCSLASLRTISRRRMTKPSTASRGVSLQQRPAAGLSAAQDRTCDPVVGPAPDKVHREANPPHQPFPEGGEGMVLYSVHDRVQHKTSAAPLCVGPEDFLLVLETRPAPVSPGCIAPDQLLRPQNTGHLSQQQHDFRHRRRRAPHYAGQDACCRLIACDSLEEVRRVGNVSAQAPARDGNRADVACLPTTALGMMLSTWRHSRQLYRSSRLISTWPGPVACRASAAGLCILQSAHDER